MLVLTEKATSAIRALVDGPELPDGAGLRITITSADGDQDLILSAAPTPEAGDEVVETGGARVFLEAGAAAALDNEVLDAEINPRGSVKFLVAHQ